MVLGRLRGCHSLSEDMLRMCCVAVCGREALPVLSTVAGLCPAQTRWYFVV